MAATLLPAQKPSIGVGPVERCAAAGGGSICRPTTIDQLDLADPIVQVRRVVSMSTTAAASQEPLAVQLVGTMSAEVRWNGTLIGSNGVVGGDAASETPGMFRAAVPIPRQLVRTGQNILDIRLSAHHRWLPVRVPVQALDVGRYGERAELKAYIPALLTAGALLVAALYFGAASFVAPPRRGASILASVAICAALQLTIETSRSFFEYPYPWHIARISGVVLLAALTSALITAYAARRFVPGRSLILVGVSVLTSIFAVALLPSFDARAWACLAATALLCLLCAANARDRRDGRIGMIVACLFAAMLLWWGGEALDRGYYLGMAALLAGLVAEQAGVLRRLHVGLIDERERNQSLLDRLAAAESAQAAIVSFRDGVKIHRFPEADVVKITAADDYCELTVVGRLPLLIGGTLKALAEALPDRFLRVHKSCIVNLAQVAAMHPKSGGGHQLLLNDGSFAPIGRTYRYAVLTKLQSSEGGESVILCRN